MQAQVNDWLLVNSHTEGRPTRRGLIIAVGKNGAPPYTVRWIDSDHEAMVFPGPDYEVVTAVELAERDRVRAERQERLQSAILTHNVIIRPHDEHPTTS